MRWSLLPLALALSIRPSPAGACKCRVPTRADVEQDAVFAGTAVEYLAREDVPEGSPGRNGELNTATRFVVEFSREFPIGASVIVMGDRYSDCDPRFRVGRRSLVVATRVGDILVGSECAQMLGTDLKQEVQRELHLPADYLAFDTKPHPPPPESCVRPATLEQAFIAADAVLWSTPRSACSIPGTDEAEVAAVVRWAWKGAAPGDVLHLRVKSRAAPEFDDFEFSPTFVRSTKNRWPPAELLRREGDVLVHDGCLTPDAPASPRSRIAAVNHLFPLPNDYPQHEPSPREPLPHLTCSTLDQTIFDRSDAATAVARTKAQTRGGACAGCAMIPREVNRVYALWLLVAATAMSARRRAKWRHQDFSIPEPRGVADRNLAAKRVRAERCSACVAVSARLPGRLVAPGSAAYPQGHAGARHRLPQAPGLRGVPGPGPRTPCWSSTGSRTACARF